MADEKTIVLKIETITDKAVMEAYGETLDAVLGSYENNTKLISEYNLAIKANQASIKALEKEEKKWGQLNSNQQKEMRNLISENEKLKIKKAELTQITKNQIKIDQSHIGTMENKSQLLGKLRMAWRKMTDEQKNANQGMLKTIQQLDKSLKGADGNIGNFQRNVGDYKGMVNGFSNALAGMGDALAGAGGKVGALGTALTVAPKALKGAGWIGLAITAATAAFTTLEKAMYSTQTTGDWIDREVAGWSSTWEQFLRMIATADFSNFIDQLTNAYFAAKDLAEVRDEMFEKENSIRLLKAKQGREEQAQLRIMRDQTKSTKERIAAGKEYERLVISNAQAQEAAYKKLADAEWQGILSKINVDKEYKPVYEEGLREFITNYASPEFQELLDIYNQIKGLQDSLENNTPMPYSAGKKLRRDPKITKARIEELKNYFNEIGEKAPESILTLATSGSDYFGRIVDLYNSLNDEAITPFIAATEKAESAMANALKETNRAATTVSGLEKKLQAEAEKNKPKKKVEVAVPITVVPEVVNTDQIDVAQAEAELKTMADDMVAEIESAIEGGLNGKSLRKQRISPLAKAFKISSEEAENIEQELMQLATDIFDSISQISQEATQRQLDRELSAIEDEAERERKILEKKLDQRLISQEQYEKKLAELDEESRAREAEAQRKAFEKQKAWNIAQALMNGALAITNIWAQHAGNVIYAGVLTGITAAQTAAQVAVIASQTFARGGELKGASHAQGGIKGFVGNQHIEAEGGEVIINKRSSAKHRKLLSLINSDNGWGVDFANARGSSGRFFARGGMIGGYDFRTSPLPDTGSSLARFAQQQADNLQASIDAINRRIDNLRVSVLLSDIEAKSNEKRVHISRAVL